MIRAVPLALFLAAALPVMGSGDELLEETIDLNSSALQTNSEEVDCGCEKLKAIKKKVASAHKPLFYDNDFSYLCDSCYCDWWPGDHLKRNGHGCAVLDIGGQYRMRYHNEHNFRGAIPVVGAGLTGLDDEFLLHRTRVYGNLEIGCRFRAYAEYIDAVSFYENIAPRGIEENRSDLLNAFGELLVVENGNGQLWLRAGRQELLYGAQRTVSPLDWANTRRTFEGYKGYWRGCDWAVDAFWVNTVNPNTRQFDSPNDDEEFMGVYATYKGCPDRPVDLYYLRLRNQIARNDFTFHTVGGRTQGSHGNWLYEVEGAYQFGDNTDGTDHSAGAWTAGLGYRFACHCWKPTVWCYYDWASGADARGAGNGYHHLFPLAHKYLGFIDLFGRRNIEDANVLLTMQPHERVKLLAWYHAFHLENGADSPYTVVMTPFNAGNAPGSTDLGQELDLLVSATINARTNLLLGYSHFWAGRYYDTTAGVPTNRDADFFYTQLQFNF